MKLTIPPIQIKENEGFGSGKDIFSRKEFGERLAGLVAQTKGELVLAIDAQWGEGKSTFIKMWKGHILHHCEPKIRSIYFDAFTNDYQKDPFLALAAEIYELLEDDKGEEKKKFRMKAGNAAKALLRGALKIGVRVGTGGVLDGTEVDTAEDVISKLFGKDVDSVIADRLESTVKDKQALKDFRIYLEGFAKQYGEGMPIVFIIDELDRCRPDFALDLIEQIKHLFSVQGITFLLVLNRKPLEASIQSRYGVNDIDATAYLQKFVNLWLTLPRKYDIYDDHGVKYVKHILDSMLDKGEQVSNQQAVELLKELVKYLKPSYREIERTLSYFALIHNMSDKSQQSYFLPYQLIISFVCFLKSLQPNLIDRIVRNKMDSKTLIEEAGLKDIDEKSKYKSIYRLTRFVIFDFADEVQKKKMMDEGTIKTDEGFDRDSNTIIVTVCSWLTDIHQ